MPKVTAEYRVAKRGEIADAALRCFATKGFQRSSMADIIAESGLSAGAIYGHFTSKQEIILEVARRMIGNRSAELRELSTAEELPVPGDVLGVLMAGFTTDSLGAGVLLQLWGEAVVNRDLGPIVIESLFVQLQVALENYLTAWAVRARGMDVSAAAEFATRILPVVLGLGQGYIVQSALIPNFDSAHYLREARELLPH
jgi:TetR/AcrR family transcriptional regulator, transcriptional repressor of aconitase